MSRETWPRPAEQVALDAAFAAWPVPRRVLLLARVAGVRCNVRARL
jgi:hypothetical protein